MNEEPQENILYVIGGGLTQATAARCGRVAHSYGLESICQEALRLAGEDLTDDPSAAEVEKDVINQPLLKSEWVSCPAPDLETKS